jgi:hypothetical protein
MLPVQCQGHAPLAPTANFAQSRQEQGIGLGVAASPFNCSTRTSRSAA